jgi:hypothetical protein
MRNRSKEQEYKKIIQQIKETQQIRNITNNKIITHINKHQNTLQQVTKTTDTTHINKHQ